ncbi:DNA polymerase III subunit delta' [Aquincola sp. MAHUQ-54]|uniref:DNA polymerase III subunit delta n=1 Tax=Aquincola agrisoli TaxID=3119538 RepID=A0AAW9QHJ0_9BURK
MVTGPDGALSLPWLRPVLDRALAQVRGHSTLVHGPGGVGQFELAIALAQAWLCEAEGPGQRPCGRCAACHLMQARMHPDFHLLLPDALREPLGWGGDAEGGAKEGGEGKKAKPSREVRVEAVRAAIDWSQQTSSRGKGKVVVIHPAQAMNAIAANALLKTLEEPPGSVRLLLCTHDPESLLPTIRSRCQRLAVPRPERAVALAWLEAQGAREADVLYDASGEQPLEAVAMLRVGIDAAAWRRLPASLQRGEASALTPWPLPRAIDALQKLCHDLMAAAVGAPARYFAAADLPPGAALPALAGWQASLRRAARHDEHPWNAPLLVEALVAEGRALWPPARAGTPHRLGTLSSR